MTISSKKQYDDPGHNGCADDPDQRQDAAFFSSPALLIYPKKSRCNPFRAAPVPGSTCPQSYCIQKASAHLILKVFLYESGVFFLIIPNK
jgi:hypothetical protein